MTRQVVYLEDLGCPSCAAQLEQAAKKLRGMQSAQVAFGPGTLTVEFDPEQISIADIEALVARFGLGIAAVMEG